MSAKVILFIEAFFGGSHKQLIDLLLPEFSDCADLFTLPAKKWHWRSLTSSLYFAEVIPRNHNYRILFTSSVLPLADLVAIRPDLARLHKIVYFHENQMVYPVRLKKERYFQHGYNEILSCLTADQVLFNSNYNKESFLSSLSSHLSIMPDHKPKHLKEHIQPKCSVMPFPVTVPDEFIIKSGTKNSVQRKTVDPVFQPLHIVWPHRWEHDKNPEAFFEVLFKLKKEDIPFKLSVVGESFTEKPKIFDEAEVILKDNIVNWGYQESKQKYYSVLCEADVVVSTADHEFFGVSMLEAAMCNCFPLCPNKLVYPEIYSAFHLYNTNNQLYKKLKYFCKKPHAVHQHGTETNFAQFTWEALRGSYRRLFEHERTSIKEQGRS